MPLSLDDMEQDLSSLDRRVGNIEQILPILATKDEMREEAERTRAHMDVVAESLRDDIRLIASGLASLSLRHDAFREETRISLAAVDRRLTRLEVRDRR